MTVNEIQIGEYVNYRGQVIKVTSLYAKGGSNEVGWSDKDSVWVNASNVEPIPLIPDILEKNGWRDISDHTLMGSETFRLNYEQNGFDFTITLKLRDYLKIQSYDDRYYTIYESCCGVKYTHQLQHALRLCGIEKEIIL